VQYLSGSIGKIYFSQETAASFATETWVTNIKIAWDKYILV